MCSSVWSRLSPVFSWKFICYLYPLQHDSTLKQTFYSKVFFEKWNCKELPKKKSQQRELGNDKWYNQMGEVRTSWVRGTSGTRRKGSSDLSLTSGTRRGVFRSSWDKWDKDKGSVHLNHSTCPKWDYKAVQCYSRGFLVTSMLRVTLVTCDQKFYLRIFWPFFL